MEKKNNQNSLAEEQQPPRELDKQDLERVTGGGSLTDLYEELGRFRPSLTQFVE